MIHQRILGRINREEFLGRDAELREIVRHASQIGESRALVLLATPESGAAELVRQSYDQMFARRGHPIPLHFAFKRDEGNPNEIARRFFQTLLQQYVAYRCVDPALSQAPLTLNDMLEFAVPGDYELVSTLIESFQRERDSDENLLTLCLSLPHRLAVEGRSICPLIDCLAISPFRNEVAFAHRLISAVARGRGPFVVAGLRRQMADLFPGPDDGGAGACSTLHIEKLNDNDARRVVEVLADRYQVETNESTRDLIVQQLNASAVLIAELLQTARVHDARLTSFLACQRLYVDDLMGGGIKRHFDRILDLVVPGTQSRRALLRLLYESAISETHKSSLWTWKKRLGLTAPEFERSIDALHVSELVNSSGAFIEVNTETLVWLDYLRAQYRIGGAKEPRAQIVAATLLETLKRAPQTMAEKYRREAALGLGQLLSRFDCQSIPATLFHYDRFAKAYRGEDDYAIEKGLEGETELMQLPQIVQTSACSSYTKAIACDPQRCVVAHGFEAGEYTDEDEIVWLCAEIDSKLEASRELTEDWCSRLASFARECGFGKFRVWLVAPEGFSASAIELLNERGAYSCNHRQIEFLRSHLEARPAKQAPTPVDEFEMVIPMGADTELIAARTVEQIARRVNFRPEAINQIKTALVEACINAAEHSLSPDRKIYQRFLVEGDKLVITVASRGVVPAQRGNNGASEHANGNSRRGWGLKLIKTLMDEVEFERVDDGTQLRMTKYIK